MRIHLHGVEKISQVLVAVALEDELSQHVCVQCLFYGQLPVERYFFVYFALAQETAIKPQQSKEILHFLLVENFLLVSEELMGQTS